MNKTLVVIVATAIVAIGLLVAAGRSGFFEPDPGEWRPVGDGRSVIHSRTGEIRKVTDEASTTVLRTANAAPSNKPIDFQSAAKLANERQGLHTEHSAKSPVVQQSPSMSTSASVPEVSETVARQRRFRSHAQASLQLLVDDSDTTLIHRDSSGLVALMAAVPSSWKTAAVPGMNATIYGGDVLTAYAQSINEEKWRNGVSPKDGESLVALLVAKYAKEKDVRTTSSRRVVISGREAFVVSTIYDDIHKEPVLTSKLYVLIGHDLGILTCQGRLVDGDEYDSMVVTYTALFDKILDSVAIVE